MNANVYDQAKYTGTVVEGREASRKRGAPFGLVLWYWGQKGRPGEMIYDDEIPSVAYSPEPNAVVGCGPV